LDSADKIADVTCIERAEEVDPVVKKPRFQAPIAGSGPSVTLPAASSSAREAAFKSGKCFLGSTGSTSGPAPSLSTAPARTANKQFSRPQILGSMPPETRPQEPTLVKPRHDPTAPGALVLPRPSQTHQWECNKSGVAVVDVVVDPYLASNLRPHQREGVTFLYSCVMVMTWALGRLCSQGPYGGKPVAKKILVVTPGSLVKNWHAEFKKWLGFERLQEFTKTSIYPVLIISYEMFVRMFDLLQKLTFDLIVCDEGTSSGFKRVYEDPIVSSRQPGATPAQVALGEERGAELARMTQMFVLRRTQEINNKYLPPKKEIVLFCRPSPLQLSLYHQLLRSQLVRSCLSGCLAGSPHLVCIGALKQLCNHPGLIYQKALKAQRDKDELENAETSVYDGLLELFPDDFKPDRRLEEHSGKLTVLSALLHCIHTSDMLEKIVVVSNHTKGSIEEKVYQRQISKQGLSGAVMDARDKGKSDDLFTINLTTDCDTHDLLSCECGGSGQKVENPVSVAEQRSCQLGAPARASRAWYLEDARDAVSFVFYSEVKASS
ncbi:RA54B-like protein, partial [Mya arenaria]